MSINLKCCDTLCIVIELSFELLHRHAAHKLLIIILIYSVSICLSVHVVYAHMLISYW